MLGTQTLMAMLWADLGADYYTGYLVKDLNYFVAFHAQDHTDVSTHVGLHQLVSVIHRLQIYLVNLLYWPHFNSVYHNIAAIVVITYWDDCYNLGTLGRAQRLQEP